MVTPLAGSPVGAFFLFWTSFSNQHKTQPKCRKLDNLPHAHKQGNSKRERKATGMAHGLRKRKGSQCMEESRYVQTCQKERLAKSMETEGRVKRI